MATHPQNPSQTLSSGSLSSAIEISAASRKNQPFCDGSHAGSEFTPLEFNATESRTVYFCGCKHSKAGALYDGSHKNL
ncbi:MAG: CDGSH iron-sulfur domain-containing protein [Betaproteobacteria bacterium]|jgi:CDGSH-type Zn-finger protein|nr:CDGSH iron-sulfur domain-containing protein [Betaproteobacteria bacterium]